MRDRELRDDLAKKAHAGVRAHYGVKQMAERTAAIFARQRNPVPCRHSAKKPGSIAMAIRTAISCTSSSASTASTAMT